MAQVFLGLGSNLSPKENIVKALTSLKKIGEINRISTVFECAAVGFDGPDFWNLVISLSTDLSVEDLHQSLRAIEYQHGRPENAKKFSNRHLDIDILLFDDKVGEFAGVSLPRDEITYHAFVLKPLAEIFSEGVHPELGFTYRSLWLSYSGNEQLSPEYEFTHRLKKEFLSVNLSLTA
ncbi:2-amino-4-hydroxy-6-hydroxymethyldihydropteridine diphosphokinase [Sessilibacter corallicola]|uniref:2-amino-4-hydroxy-6- hydroxymethyldihydropteridine diphosphokinase n=1 Tax=Sessilibacter corallicola TaxID=2904075 RepID=UPI001E51AA17|nr:2-amino-4-hydroxy-6-hydroxymethyldihydropteridine diphosphokinase [Sessilibacter corallicola]